MKEPKHWRTFKPVDDLTGTLRFSIFLVIVNILVASIVQVKSLFIEPYLQCFFTSFPSAIAKSQDKSVVPERDLIQMEVTNRAPKNEQKIHSIFMKTSKL